MTRRIPQDSEEDFVVRGTLTITHIDMDLLEEYMTRRIPQDHNYRTACPASIKAKITELENAAFEYGLESARYASANQTCMGAQTARYNLERTILTCIEAAVAAALDANTERTK